MISLNKWDMEYLAGGGDDPMWRNPQTKKREPYPFPEGRKELLDSFIVEEDGHFLEMDSHGVNIHLFAYRETKDGPLLGFLWGSSSEESFYGEDYFSQKDLGPFEVTRKEVKTYEYSRTDRSMWLA